MAICQKLKMKLKRVGFSLFVLAFAGTFSCAHKVILDPSPSPMKNGQGRVETVLCKHYAVGDNACWVSEGEDPEIFIKTYFDGILFLKSSRCGIGVRHSYKNHEPFLARLSDLMPDKLSGFCFIDILLAPVFPDVEENDIPVESMTGRLVLVEKTNKTADVYGNGESDGGVLLLSMPETEVFNLLNVVSVNTYSDAGSIMIAGCGLEPRQQFYNRGLDPYSIPVIAMFGGIAPMDEHCVFYGRVNPWDRDYFRDFIVAIEVYSDDLVPLAEPTIEIDGKNLIFTSFEPISWSILNGTEVINSGSGKFKIDPNETNELVQLTAQGRSKIILIESGEISWSK